MATPTQVLRVNDVDKALGLIVSKANRQNDHKTIMTERATSKMLRDRTGTAYSEVYYKRLHAYDIEDDTVETNPQMLTDEQVKFYLSMISIYTVWNWKVTKRLQVDALDAYSNLASMAIKRRIDEQGLVTIAGASTQETVATLSSAHLAAAKARIIADDNPPMDKDTAYGVFHSFTTQALYNQMAYIPSSSQNSARPYPTGPSADAVKAGPKSAFECGGVMVDTDNNMKRDASNNANGAVWNREALWYITSNGPNSSARKELPEIGGGSTGLFLRSEQAWAIPSFHSGKIITIEAGAVTPSI